MNSQTLEGRLLFAQNAIANSLGNREIRSMMAELGYDEDRLLAGQALQERANNLQIAQVKEYGEQFAATDALNDARATANAVYMKHVKVARIALRGNRGAFESLQLNGIRKKSISGWLRQAKAFYANTTGSPEILNALAGFAITETQLMAAQTQVAAVEGKFNEQLKEKGEAQNATKERDGAFDDLQEWMGDFTTIARVALETKPQYLEILGVVEPS